jgi:BMFP domain-containing protein YqiC
MSNELTIPGSKVSAIISRAGDLKSLTFKTIDEKALTEINDWMPEVNRATSAFQKQNSQTTSSLMSLAMIDSGPYRVLRQILAQAEKKRSALKENIYNLEVKKIEYQELEHQLHSAGEPLKRKKIELEMNKIGCDIVDSQGPIEASLKELGALKRRYEEICKNKNIPENWSEDDFEEAEIEHHIKSIFRNALRDRLQGSHNMGTMEYMHQFGINSITAYAFVDDYIRQVKQAMGNNNVPSIDTEYEFLDKMYDIFKNEYKKAAQRIGLDNITHADFLMKENT